MPINVSGAVQSVMGTVAGLKIGQEHLQNQAFSEVASATEGLANATEVRNTQEQQVNELETQLNTEQKDLSDENLQTLVDTQKNTNEELKDQVTKYTMQMAQGKNRDDKTGKFISKKDAEERLQKTNDDLTAGNTALKNLEMKQQARVNMKKNIELRKQTLQLANEKVNRAQQRLDAAKQNKHLKGGKK